MSTQPRKIYVVMRDGKPLISYGREEDAETYIEINGLQHNAEVFPLTYIEFPTFGLLPR